MPTIISSGLARRVSTISMYKGLLQTIAISDRLVDECPDAVNSSFNLMWFSLPRWKSAMGVHDLQFWQYVHFFFVLRGMPGMLRIPH
jgi:hypothetical protein